jgi:predicted kinase
MGQQLYLFMGFPGAGKTTVAQYIAETTGAVHLWADKERRQLFQRPSHSAEESRQLYDALNQRTDELLGEGKSVIFDTNFNFYKDREHLRQIAAKHGVQTIVVWMVTPKELAKQRAVHEGKLRNGYEELLPESEFERMSNHLEEPRSDEHVIQIDGSHLTKETTLQLLGLQ